MKRAFVLCSVLVGCHGPAEKASLTTSSVSLQSASPAPTAPQSASERAPSFPAPPALSSSREAREKAALALLEGHARAADLPLADVDPGESYEPALRAAMGSPMTIYIGAITTQALDERAVKQAIEPHIVRFRHCYASGLWMNPNLQGRVVARVLLQGGGKPKSALNGGSDMPDSRVVECVLKAFEKIDFPAPSEDHGVATVPILLVPG